MDDLINFDIDNLNVSESLICNPEDCLTYLSSIPLRITVLNQNIRSISCNFSGLEIFLKRISFNCSVIVLTECWLSDLTILPQLDGYICCASKNNPIKNDGVVVYSKMELNVSIEEPLFQDANCMVLKIGTHTAFVGIYRSPSYKNLENFNHSLNSVLSKLASYRNIFLLGDLNIDIRDDYVNSGGREYLSICASHGLMPAHTLSTHQSGSCLDHFIIKCQNVPAITLVMNTTVTDHSAVLFCCSTRSNNEAIKAVRTSINYNQLEIDIQNIDFNNVYTTRNPDNAIEYLISNIQKSISNNSCITKYSRRTKPIKPWITTGLLRCIRFRDRLHKKCNNTPDNASLKLSYLRYRNYCNGLIKKVKRDYERKELINAGSNSKKLWKAIKNITHTNITKTIAHELVDKTSNTQSSVDSVNEFFVNVGKSLASNFCAVSRFNIAYESYSLKNSLVLLPCDAVEVEIIIRNLKTACATGWDGISNEILKLCKDYLIPPLVHIFNCCFSEGIFPKFLKRSLIHPIYKAGKRDCVNNYRPISILPSISKILERLIYSRLVIFLEKYNLISNHQFGFRSGKSANDAIIELTNYVVTNLDNNNKCIGIFLDLAKAFDTVSIPLLLNKLERSGIRGVPLKLFKDYLSDRVQCVKIGENISQYLAVQYGVPQGSILGPILFLLYINDVLELRPAQGKMICYADDTVLLFSANTWKEAFNAAQMGFNSVSKWLKNNVLSLNADKTKVITFAMKNTSLPTPDLVLRNHICDFPETIACTCLPLITTNCVKYLGIIVDYRLSFKEHIQLVATRVRKLIYIFKTLRHIADYELIKKVYLALCQSITVYGILSWGGAPKTTMLTLEIAQRYILKVCTFRPILYPTEQLYQICDVLTVRQLFILQVLLKQHSKLYFTNETLNKRRFDRVCDIIGARHMFTRRFFNILGPVLYNKINRLLHIFPLTTHESKIKIKTFLKTLNYSDTEMFFKHNM